jgi:MoxR-like ATPase
MRTRCLLATLFAIGLSVPAVFAQTPQAAEPAQRPLGIRARQARQAARIDQGIQSGAINRAEARRLRALQARIRSMARQFRQSDDRLSRTEMLRLQRNLGHASRAIRRAVRNGRASR